jgi:hypothetical protein
MSDEMDGGMHELNDDAPQFMDLGGGLTVDNAKLTEVLQGLLEEWKSAHPERVTEVDQRHGLNIRPLEERRAEAYFPGDDEHDELRIGSFPIDALKA